VKSETPINPTETAKTIKKIKDKQNKSENKGSLSE